LEELLAMHYTCWDRLKTKVVRQHVETPPRGAANEY